jgi:AbrB family looped-hinge helix DNA binding protein
MPWPRPHLDRLRALGHAADVTTTISSSGRVVIPRRVRERSKLRAGDGLLVLELSNGDILLRHMRKPRKPLKWHLRRLRGVVLDRPADRPREVAW